MTKPLRILLMAPALLLLALLLAKGMGWHWAHPLGLRFGLVLALLNIFQWYTEQKLKGVVDVQPLYSYLVGFMLRLFLTAGGLGVLLFLRPALVQPLKSFVFTLLFGYVVSAVFEVWALLVRLGQISQQKPGQNET